MDPVGVSILAPFSMGKSGSLLIKSLKYAGDFDPWVRFFQYNKRFVADAIVGVFRWRNSDLITLEYFEGHLKEVEEFNNDIGP